LGPDLQNMDLRPNHFTLSESHYGPLTETHYYLRITIWTIVWPNYTLRIRIWTLVRTTLLSPNHNLDRCLNRTMLSESEYGTLSEPHYYLRITIRTIVWTTLPSLNHNTDHCLNHIIVSESQYGPLSEPHYHLRITIRTIVWTTLLLYLRITIRTTFWTILLSPNHNTVHCLNHIMLSESKSSINSNKY